jgi:hypothetical protein
MMGSMSVNYVALSETDLLMKEPNGAIMMTEKKKKDVLDLQHPNYSQNLHTDL